MIASLFHNPEKDKSEILSDNFKTFFINPTRISDFLILTGQ